MMTPAGDIDVVGKRCLVLFKEVYNLVNKPSSPYTNDISPTDVKDERGRFKIWGENIGAFQPISTRSSLEYRLQDASQTRRHVLRILENLQESLYESSSTVSPDASC